MRKVNVFKFDELDKKAQTKVVEYFRYSDRFDFFSMEEIVDCLSYEHGDISKDIDDYRYSIGGRGDYVSFNKPADMTQRRYKELCVIILKSATAEYENQFEDEYIIDMIRINELEFFANGEQYRGDE